MKPQLETMAVCAFCICMCAHLHMQVLSSPPWNLPDSLLLRYPSNECRLRPHDVCRVVNPFASCSRFGKQATAHLTTSHSTPFIISHHFSCCDSLHSFTISTPFLSFDGLDSPRTILPYIENQCRPRWCSNNPGPANTWQQHILSLLCLLSCRFRCNGKRASAKTISSSHGCE